MFLGMLFFVDSLFGIDFIRRKSDKLVIGSMDSVVYLRGTAFIGKMKEYSEEDFKTIASTGMNLVNVHLSYKSIETESQKDTLWKYLNQYLKLAAKYNLRVIFTLREPPGGFQWKKETYGKLWEQETLQKELLTFWKIISSKYRNEPIIAGYDLLYLPHPTESIVQWELLANKIVQTIRENDLNHLLIIENARAIRYNWTARKEYLKVSDENIMYSFEFICPEEYTEQLTSWDKADGGIYPDPGKFQTINCMSTFPIHHDEPTFAKDGKWSYYEGTRFKVTNPWIKVATPCLNSCYNPGRALFYGFVIKEFGPDGAFVRNVMEVDFSDQNDWHLWSKVSPPVGKSERGMANETVAEGYKRDIIILSGTNNITRAGNHHYRFPVKQGYSYSISGWGKVENATPQSQCYFSLTFEGTEEQAVVLPRTREYLKRELERITEFGKKNLYPMFVSHYWVSNACFMEKRGGEEWLTDVLVLFDESNLHSSFSSYKGTNEGFTNAQGDEKNIINKSIEKSFRTNLFGSKKRKVFFKVNTTGNSYKIKLTNITNPNDTFMVASDREGKFVVSLLEGNRYNVEINSVKGYIFYNETIKISPQDSISYAKDSSTIALTLKPLDSGTVFPLKNIYYEFNAHEPSSHSYPELNQLLLLMKNNPDLVIAIEAHTDDVGSDKFNLLLSEQRANSIRTYLLKKGIDDTKIRIKACGKMNPLYPNNSQTNRAKNRRVEIRVVQLSK